MGDLVNIISSVVTQTRNTNVIGSNSCVDLPNIFRCACFMCSAHGIHEA